MVGDPNRGPNERGGGMSGQIEKQAEAIWDPR